MFLSILINDFDIRFYIINEQQNIEKFFTISYIKDKSEDQYFLDIRNSFEIIKINKEHIIYASILSSCEKMKKIVLEFFDRYFRINPIVITNNMLEIEFLEQNVNRDDLPLDILIGSYFASYKYGENVIFINTDNLISFSAIIDNNKFLGYSIYPGLNLLSNVIHDKTSSFPEILIRSVNYSLDYTKYKSQNCGAFLGTIGAIDYILSSIKNEFFRKDFTIVCAGNDVEIISKYSSVINKIDKHLLAFASLFVAQKQLVGI